eukprot:scpid13653/ scgid1723/ Dynein assembly factor 3, axonemal
MADSIQWWGFSPGRSLLAEGSVADSNVLLAGSVDVRMVLMTLADLKSRWTAGESPDAKSAKIQFFIAENSLDTVAKQLLLLTLVMDDTEDISIQERTSLFLELFGNSLVRPQTAVYLSETSKRLVRMVTDDDYMKVCLPMVDLSSLRFKERDALEDIFKSWRSTVAFDVQTHWDGRVRHNLAARYDARYGVFDWDYNMKLMDMPLDISWPEYKEWRDTGVGFQLRDSASYSEPNRSISTCVHERRTGERRPVSGYYGDITTGPFVAFTKHQPVSEKKRDTTGAQHPQKAGVETRQTVSDIIESLRGPASSGDAAKASASLATLQEEDETEESSPTTQASAASPLKELQRNVSIHFLRLDAVATLGQQSKYTNFFHCAFFSNRMVHHLKANISEIFTDNARLFTETVLFVLDLSKEKKDEHTKRVTALAKALNFQLQASSDQ